MEEKIDLTPLTPEDIRGIIHRVDYQVVPGTTTTLAVVVTNSGFVAVGQSGVMDPKLFDLEKGKEYALKRAYDKLFEHEGYLKLYQNFKANPAEVTNRINGDGIYRGAK